MAAQRTRQASLLRLHGALRAREWDAALALLARDAARCEHQTFESLEASSFRTRITACIIDPQSSRDRPLFHTRIPTCSSVHACKPPPSARPLSPPAVLPELSPV